MRPVAITSKSIPRPSSVVFALLTTPETYPHWLVGCQDIRAVDAGWPEVGTCFHHRVGLAGPITVSDSTRVLEIVESELLVLEARARPLGRARVAFTLEPEGSGTRLSLDEVPIGGLAPLQPALDPLTAKRNERSLSRLASYLDAEQKLTTRLR
jgi:uncharacterized protein YndB with AHSA1/START domain